MSPAFDINPTPDGHGSSLNIDQVDNRLSFDLYTEVHPFFRWKETETLKEIEKVKKIRKSFESRAKKLKMKRSEIESTRSTFENAV